MGLVVNEILRIKLGLIAEHYIKNFQQVPLSRVGFFFYRGSAFLFSTPSQKQETSLGLTLLCGKGFDHRVNCGVRDDSLSVEKYARYL